MFVMKTKISKKILIWGDGAFTMNTKGERIFTMEIKTLYCIWKIPIWKTVKYVDRAEIGDKKKELLGRVIVEMYRLAGSNWE